MTITRSELLRALERLRLNICAYGGGGDGRCDCKFGTATPCYGEENGCPELRVAFDMINQMTGAEFKGLALRVAEKKGRGIECRPQFRRQTSLVPSEKREGPSLGALKALSRAFRSRHSKS